MGEEFDKRYVEIVKLMADDYTERGFAVDRMRVWLGPNESDEVKASARAINAELKKLDGQWPQPA